MICDECFGTGCNLCDDESGYTMDAYIIRDKQRSCEIKKRYLRETDVRMAIQRREKEGRILLKAYKCRYCTGWHMSKRLGLTRK